MSEKITLKIAELQTELNNLNSAITTFEPYSTNFTARVIDSFQSSSSNFTAAMKGALDCMKNTNAPNLIKSLQAYVGFYVALSVLGGEVVKAGDAGGLAPKTPNVPNVKSPPNIPVVPGEVVKPPIVPPIIPRPPIPDIKVPDGVPEADIPTRTQTVNMQTIDNIIKNNLTEGDFSATLADLQGKPIPKPGGGYYDHLQEMKQSYEGLKKSVQGLEGSLKNPNLSDNLRKTLQASLDKALSYMKRIEELFSPYGGIK